MTTSNHAFCEHKKDRVTQQPFLKEQRSLCVNMRTLCVKEMPKRQGFAGTLCVKEKMPGICKKLCVKEQKMQKTVGIYKKALCERTENAENERQGFAKTFCVKEQKCKKRREFFARV
jgi:hypothetical protein